MKKTISRRNFVRDVGITLSSAFATPYIINSTAWGNSNTPPPSERVILGHIGVGGRGSSLLRNFLQLKDVQSVAVCDVFKSKRESVAKEIEDYYSQRMPKKSYKGCSAYNDFNEILERNDIDAVVIATPDHWHVPLTLAAARAGKDMYVEKPLGLSLSEDQLARQAVLKYERIFQYGTQQRSGRNFRFACELTRNKQIGELHTIHAWCTDISSQANAFNEPGGSMKPIPIPEGFDYERWIGSAPLSPYTSDRCTSFGTYHHYDNCLGFIAGWGAHPLDIAQWGNNTDHCAPIEYYGFGTIPEDGLFRSVSSWDVWCKYHNGIKMRFMSTEIARPVVESYHPDFRDHGTTFIGTDGWVSVDRSNIYTSPPSLLNYRLKSHDIHLYESNNHQKNFIDCVKSRSQPISTVGAAAQSDYISQLSDISIRLGRKISWNPATEEIVGDDQAIRMLHRPRRAPWCL
jgi:glucose-fructose oxidoreductase